MNVSLQLAAATHDVIAARELGAQLGGRLFVDTRVDAGESTDHLPFPALLCVATDDLEAVREIADVGLYLIARRVIKPRAEAAGVLPGVIGLFTMVANPDLGPKAADRYWRDQHAPLALKVHVAMNSYAQLSVQHRFDGPDWHGFALCGFPSLTDLREKFFDSDAGRKAIRADTQVFADGEKSPRRLIVQEELFVSVGAGPG